MKTISVFLSILIGIFANAQKLSFDQKLTEKPEIANLVSEVMINEFDDQTILDERFIEFNFDEKEQLVEYLYIHKIKYANNDEAIEKFNKIFIYLSDANELVDYNARVILKNGNIKNLGKDALKEGIDEDESKYKYFAVSGVEKGSFIEYFYTIKRLPVISGNYIILQDNTPTRVSRFRCYSPKNLIFAFKANNGYTQPQIDTTIKDVNLWKAETKEIGKSQREVFGNADGNRMNVVYHFNENAATSKKNFYTYASVSQNVFENLNKALSKSATKKIKKIIENSDVKYAVGNKEKIMAIEHLIKSKFNFVSSSDPKLNDTDFMLDNNVVNDFGAIYIFYQIFKMLEYKMEIVLTSNRYKIRFDEKFENYSYLKEYLIYFPEFKEYLMPSAPLYRLGLLPAAYIYNHGLFVRTVSAGGIETGAGKVKFIEPIGSDKTKHEINCKIEINSTNDSLIVDTEQIYTGYYAQNYQPIFDFIDNDKLRQFEESIVKTITPNIKIKKLSIENKGAKYLMNKPLIVKSSFSTGELIETAGNKILVKIGELIGPQVEMYQQEKRTHPVENDFNRCYIRQLIFQIPEGYKCANPESLNISVTPFEDKTAYFTSTYKKEGNTIIVDVKEYYNRIYFSDSEFNDYRNVINAAANFNKIVLVIEKL